MRMQEHRFLHPLQPLTTNLIPWRTHPIVILTLRRLRLLTPMQRIVRRLVHMDHTLVAHVD